MMSISHKQARAWIDEQANDSLIASNKNLLQTHLGACAECSAYAAEIMGLEKSLGDSFNERWGQPSLGPKELGQLVTNVQEASPQGGSKSPKKGPSNGNGVRPFFMQPLVLGIALLAILLGAAVFIYYGNYGDSELPQLPEQLPDGQDIPDLPPLPDCPNNYSSTAQQVYPAEGDLVLNLTPEFEWTFPFECKPLGFHLKVGTMTDPQSDDVFDGDSIGLLRTFSGVNLLPATWHRWRIYTELVPGVENSNGNFVSFVTGPTCGAGDLLAPTLIYPADGSIYTGKSWGNPYEVEADIVYPGGTCIPDGFTFYISETEDFSTPNLNIFSPGANFTPNSDGLLLVEDDSNDVPDCTILYWKAWATVDGASGPESEVFSFYTDIEGTCFIPPSFDDISYIRAPQDANCRASDYSDSTNLGTLFEGEQVAVLAINPEATHVKVMEPSFNVSCWVWLGVVDLMKGNMPIDPELVLGLVPVVDPPEQPTEEPADEPPDEPDDDDPTEEPAQCSDGIDNDGDGRTDYGDKDAIANGTADRECSSPDDDNEFN